MFVEFCYLIPRLEELITSEKEGPTRTTEIISWCLMNLVLKKQKM